MTSTIKILLPMLFISFAGCSSLEPIARQNGVSHSADSDKFEQSPTSQFGWNNSNCAHIQADGHCAHPIAPNLMDPSSNPSMGISNSNGWNSTNCAHITADGGCAHPL